MVQKNLEEIRKSEKCINSYKWQENVERHDRIRPEKIKNKNEISARKPYLMV